MEDIRMTKKQLKLETMIIIGKFSDGKVRQLVMHEGVKEIIEKVLAFKTGTILVINEPIEDLDIKPQTI